MIIFFFSGRERPHIVQDENLDIIGLTNGAAPITCHDAGLDERCDVRIRELVGLDLEMLAHERGQLGAEHIFVRGRVRFLLLLVVPGVGVVRRVRPGRVVAVVCGGFMEGRGARSQGPRGGAG